MSVTVVKGAGSVSAVVEVYRGRSAELGAELEALLAVDALRAELDTVIQSRQFTTAGLAPRREAIAAKGTSVVEPFDAATERLRDEYQHREDAEIRALVPAVTPADAAAVTAWLMTKPRNAQVTEYLAAINNGDWRTVAAIHALPSSMSPLDDAARRGSRERLLAQLPDARRAVLNGIKARIGAREHASLRARRIVKDLRGVGGTDAG